MVIRSVPDPAMVWLGERFLGVTPILLDEVVPGEYRVKAIATGFQLWQGSFTFAENDRKTITLALDPMRPER